MVTLNAHTTTIYTFENLSNKAIANCKATNLTSAVQAACQSFGLGEYLDYDYSKYSRTITVNNTKLAWYD